MAKRKIPFIFIIVAIILLVFGFSLEFVVGYQVDAKEMDHSRQVIDRNYRNMNDEMQSLADSFKGAEFSESKYYQEVIDNNEKYLAEISNINKRMTNMQSLSTKIFAECLKMPLNDRDINTKCEVLKRNYELINNTYISVIAVFNKEVELCNDWLIENAQDIKAKEYTSAEFTEYLDLDEDGILNGKF